MYERVAHRARWKLWSLPKPTIAQIHKFCLGGAHETMMACDMAICSDDTTFGIPEIKFGQGSCFPILPYSMTPVSYTHLDVYKRQGRDSDRLRYILPVKAEEFWQTLEAVSYTHLDVYKRQIFSCPKMWI